MSKNTTYLKLMSLLVDSLVRICHMQANALVWTPERGLDFGGNLPDLLANFDPESSSWRTLQGFTLWEEPTYLDRLPKWGMTQSGSLYELPTLARRIQENGGSAWPTALTTDGSVGQVTTESDVYIQHKSGNIRKYTKNNTSGSVGLARAVQLWPTCKAIEPNEKPETFIDRKERTGNQWQPALSTAVQMWGTPRASSTEKGTGPFGSKSHQHDIERSYLRAQVVTAPDVPKNLNPDWTELLMGYPSGWTDITDAGLPHPENHNTNTSQPEPSKAA